MNLGNATKFAMSKRRFLAGLVRKIQRVGCSPRR